MELEDTANPLPWWRGNLASGRHDDTIDRRIVCSCASPARPARWAWLVNKSSAFVWCELLFVNLYIDAYVAKEFVV